MVNKGNPEWLSFRDFPVGELLQCSQNSLSSATLFVIKVSPVCLKDFNFAEPNFETSKRRIFEDDLGSNTEERRGRFRRSSARFARRISVAMLCSVELLWMMRFRQWSHGPYGSGLQVSREQLAKFGCMLFRCMMVIYERRRTSGYIKESYGILWNLWAGIGSNRPTGRNSSCLMMKKSNVNPGIFPLGCSTGGVPIKYHVLLSLFVGYLHN